MRLSLELPDAKNRAPSMPSNREVNENSVTEGYFNPKFIIFAVKIITIKHEENSIMTLEETMANKERIETLLKSTGRRGIEKVLDYLEKHGFYEVPSSLRRHHNWSGGLAQHCLGVYDRLKATGKGLPEDSMILTALLHDICKVRKIYKDSNGKWKERPDRELHYKGHGSRSVKLLEKTCGLQLTPEERKAIRFHMGGYNLPKEDLREFFPIKTTRFGGC